MPSSLTVDHVARGSQPFTWAAHDGTPFPGLVWSNGNALPDRHVICIHGLSGSAADFGPLARRLCAEDCTVWALNLRGQGNDPDPLRRGHFLEPREWRADLAAFVATHLPDAPYHLIGESMGSLVAVDAVAHGALRPQRLVLSAPVPETRAPVPGWSVALMRQVSGWLPRLKISPMRFVHGKTCIPRLTADDEYMAYLDNIPHRVGGFTISFLARFHDLMQEAQRDAARIDVPTLMLSAGRDVFIHPDQSRAFFERLAAPQKEYVLYPESHHLLWHDINRDEVLDHITRWVLGAAD